MGKKNTVTRLRRKPGPQPLPAWRKVPVSPERLSRMRVELVNMRISAQSMLNDVCRFEADLDQIKRQGLAVPVEEDPAPANVVAFPRKRTEGGTDA